MRVRAEIEAEALRLMNEAHNMLSPEARASALRMRLVEKAEAIIRESVQADGAHRGHQDPAGRRPRRRRRAAANGDGSGGGFADSVVNSALRFRAQAPLVDQLLREIGLEGGDIQRLVGGASAARTAALPPARRRQGQRSSAMVRVYASSVIDASADTRLVAHPRLQRPAAVAPGHRRQPHREQRAERQGRLHPPLPHRATAA